MKSKVIRVADINKFVLEESKKTVERKNYEENLKQELEFLQRSYATTKERELHEKIEEGDSVTLDVKCDDENSPKKFNREKLVVNVGKNFYDKNLESELIGKTVGSEFSCKVGKGLEFEVDVKIVASTYMDINELTDQNIADLGYGIETVEDYKREYLASFRADENFEHFREFISKDVQKYLIENSVLDIDLDEKEKKKQSWLKEMEEYPYDEGDSFENYVRNVCGSKAETEEGLREDLLNYYDDYFKAYLIFAELGKDAQLLTPEEYEKSNEEAREKGIPLDENETYDRYVMDAKVSEGQDIVMAWAEEQYIN